MGVAQTQALWSLNTLSSDRPRRLIGVLAFRLPCGRWEPRPWHYLGQLLSRLRRRSASVDCCQTSELRSPAVTLQGTATAVKKTTSRQGNNYTLFKLEDPRGCGAVNIFTWGHPNFSNGDHVRVEGVFETVHHQDRSVFYNQVEATKVVPFPK